MPVNDLVNTVMNTSDLAALVRFETIAMENRTESLKQGKWVGADVDFVHITSDRTNEHTKKVSTWLDQLKLHLIQGRVTQERHDYYVRQYQAWKAGQEPPLEGVPIKGWGVISPAQQQVLLSIRVQTVEQLAALDDAGIRLVGMGAVDMKQKAKAWMAQIGEKGPLTIKMAALEAENRVKAMEIDTLKEQVKQLLKDVERQAYTVQPDAPCPANVITAADLMDELPSSSGEYLAESPAAKKPRGNPNWRKKTEEVSA